jgi:hypothetical protein
MVLWIGRQTPGELLKQLFDVDNIEAIDPNQVSIKSKRKYASQLIKLALAGTPSA